MNGSIQNEINHLKRRSIPASIPMKRSMGSSHRTKGELLLTLEMVKGLRPAIRESVIRKNRRLRVLVNKLLKPQIETLDMLIEHANDTFEINISALYSSTRLIISNSIKDNVPNQILLGKTPAISILTYHRDEALYPRRRNESSSSSSGSGSGGESSFYTPKRCLTHFVVGANNFVWIVCIPENEQRRNGKYAQIYEFLNLVHSLGIVVFHYGHSTRQMVPIICGGKPDHFIIPKLTDVKGAPVPSIEEHIRSNKNRLPDWLVDYELLMCEVWTRLKKDLLTSTTCANIGRLRESTPKSPLQSSFRMDRDGMTLRNDQEQYLEVLALALLHIGWEKFKPIEGFEGASEW